MDTDLQADHQASYKPPKSIDEVIEILDAITIETEKITVHWGILLRCIIK